MKTIYGVLFALLMIQCQDTNSTPDVSLLQKAQLIHLTTTTLDTHDDINVKNFTDSLNYTQN